MYARARRLRTVRQESAKALEAKKLGEARQAEVFVFLSFFFPIRKESAPVRFHAVCGIDSWLHL